MLLKTGEGGGNKGFPTSKLQTAVLFKQGSWESWALAATATGPAREPGVGPGLRVCLHEVLIHSSALETATA